MNGKILKMRIIFVFFIVICLTLIPFVFGADVLKIYNEPETRSKTIAIDCSIASQTKNLARTGGWSDGLEWCSVEGQYLASLNCHGAGITIWNCGQLTSTVCTKDFGDTQDTKIYGKAFYVNWSVNQADCECYGGDWLVKVSGTGDGNCCGDDGDEDYCGENFTSCVDGTYYGNGDSNDDTCACNIVTGQPEPSEWMEGGVCGLSETGQGDCDDITQTTTFCCGDDENEVTQAGINNVCFVEVGDCYSFSDDIYYTNGEIIGGKACENGVLTPLVRSIALQLLDITGDISPNDYTLFCDNYWHTLNYYQYIVGTTPVVDIMDAEVADFCVLRLPDYVIFGASLNTPINEGEFIDALEGVGDCNNAIDENDGQFHQCNSGNSRAWYNNKTLSIIYSNENVGAIALLPDDFQLDFWDAFLTFLRNPFQNIFAFLLSLFEDEGIGEPGGDYDFIADTTDFSRIYLDVKGIKSIKGVTENVGGREYLSVTYEKYTEDICSTVNNTADFRTPTGRDLVVCHYNSSTETYYVASNSSMALLLWPELTAMLRTGG